MAEYLCKEELIKALETDINTNWADYTSGDYIDGVRDEYDDVLEIICQQPAADVQPVDRWISVDEALPENGKTVLIYYNNQFHIVTYNSDFAETMPWKSSEYRWGKELISFWLPIPEPPETKKG